MGICVSIIPYNDNYYRFEQITKRSRITAIHAENPQSRTIYCDNDFRLSLNWNHYRSGRAHNMPHWYRQYPTTPPQSRHNNICCVYINCGLG